MASYLPGSRPNSLWPFVCRRVSPVLCGVIASRVSVHFARTVRKFRGAICHIAIEGDHAWR